MRMPNGHWSAPPPRAPCIVAEDGCCHNLERYTDMNCDAFSCCPVHSAQWDADDGDGWNTLQQQQMLATPAVPTAAPTVSAAAAALQQRGLCSTAAARSALLDAVQRAHYGAVLCESLLLRCFAPREEL
jgi:N-terminal glutamine amidase